MNKKISEFEMTLDDGLGGTATYNIATQNINVRWEPEYFNDEKEIKALSFKVYSRLAGFRLNISFNYQGNLEGDTWRDFINNLYTHFRTVGNDSCTLKPDSGVATTIDVIPSNLEYAINYSNQIGQFLPSIEFKSADIVSAIPSGWEAFS